MLVHSCMQIKIIQFKKIIMFDDSLKDENKFYCFNRLLVPEDSNMEKTIFDNKKTIFNSTKRLICVGFENNEDIFERGEKLKAIEVLENSLLNNTTEKRRITRRASQIEIFNKQLKERLSKIQNIPLLQERLSKFSTKNSIFQKNKSRKLFRLLFYTILIKKTTIQRVLIQTAANLLLRRCKLKRSEPRSPFRVFP